MTSATGDILHCNQIYYKFKNEKRKNILILNHSDQQKSIKVNQIKQKIADDLKEKQKISNLDFDLIVYAEDSSNSLNENEEINNGQIVIVERVPWYKMGNSLEIEKQAVIDEEFRKKEGKFDYNIIEKFFCSVNDPEKLLLVLNENIIKYYTCRFCGLYGEDFEYYITKCCGETGCRECMSGLYTDNKEMEIPLSEKNGRKNFEENNKISYDSSNLQEDKITCSLCSNDFKIIENFLMPNKKINELKEFLNEIKKFKLKKPRLNINIDQRNKSDDQNLENIFNQRNMSTTINTPTSLMKLTPSNYLSAGINLVYNNPNSNNFQNAHNNTRIIPHKDSDEQVIYSMSNSHFPFFENSRFFIIKSYCKENIEISQLHNEWATTVINQKKLNEAFKQKNIILIFSANKSGVFQGYAIMKNYIGDMKSNIWNLDHSVKIGGNFKVQWLCSCEFPFAKLKYLTNPLNYNEPLIKSRDTQEITKELGIQVCHLLYEQEKTKSGVQPIFNNSMITDLLEEINKNREKANHDPMNKYPANNLGYQETSVNNSYLIDSRKSSFDDRKSIIIILCLFIRWYKQQYLSEFE